MGEPEESSAADIVPTWTELDDPRAVDFVHLSLQGWTLQQIAHKLDVAPNTLWRLRQKYGLDDIVASLTKEAGEATAQAYISLRHRAMTTAQELLEHPDPSIREKALKSVLKFIGDRGDSPDAPRPTSGRRGALPSDGDLVSTLRKAMGTGGSRRGD